MNSNWFPQDRNQEAAMLVVILWRELMALRNSDLKAAPLTGVKATVRSKLLRFESLIEKGTVTML
jgi:hypothetical protein